MSEVCGGEIHCNLLVLLMSWLRNTGETQGSGHGPGVLRNIRNNWSELDHDRDVTQRQSYTIGM